MKKRIFGVMLAASMVASLAGCGAKKDDNASKAQSSVNTAMTAEEYAESITKNAEIYKQYITLPTYTGIEVSVDRSTLDITDDAVNDAINNLLSSTAETETVTEGVTASGDTVTMDFSGKLNGEAFQGGTATDTSYTIGSGKFISDLDQGLIGLTVGQEYDIPCTFPADYSSSDLAGKDVIFTVTVSSIDKKVIPELNDQWVVDNSSVIGTELTTVDELKEFERTSLEANAKSTFDSNKYASIWDTLSSQIEPTGYPQEELDSLINTLKNNIQSEFNSYGSSYGITDFNTYLSSVYGFESEDAFNQYADEYSKQYLLEKMTLTLIAANQEITVTADDINDMGNQLASYYGYNDYQEILDSYGNEMNAEVGYEVLYQKVQEFLVNSAVEA